MEKSVKITLIIGAVLIILALIGVYTVFNLFGLNKENVVSATGYSEISAMPDKVVLYLNIESLANNSEMANSRNTEILTDFGERIVYLGFKKQDLKTVSFNIYEDFDWTSDGRKSRGWKAVHSLKLEISSNETELIGRVIDAALSSRVIISYINFELSNELENQYKAEVMKLASEDARKKAEAIVAGQGKRLGKLVSVKDSSFNYYPWRVYQYSSGELGQDSAEAVKEAIVSVNPSDRKISASVSVSYRFY